MRPPCGMGGRVEEEGEEVGEEMPDGEEERYEGQREAREVRSGVEGDEVGRRCRRGVALPREEPGQTAWSPHGTPPS